MDANGTRWLQLLQQLKKKSEHQQLRAFALEKAGVSEQKTIDYPKERDLILKQTGEVFALCQNRLLMGRFRYGPNIGQSHFNCIPAIIHKLEKYIETGNGETLIDAMNYIYLEFRFGTNPKKHFRATDDEDHASMEHKW